MAKKFNPEQNLSSQQDESSDSDEDEVNLQANDFTDVTECEKLTGFSRKESNDDTSSNLESIGSKQEEVTVCQWLMKWFSNNCCCQSSEDDRTTIESDRSPLE